MKKMLKIVKFQKNVSFLWMCVNATAAANTQLLKTELTNEYALTEVEFGANSIARTWQKQNY